LLPCVGEELTAPEDEREQAMNLVDDGEPRALWRACSMLTKVGDFAGESGFEPHRPLGMFVGGIVSGDASAVGGRAACDGGGRRFLGSVAGFTGV
jgi:hypothetical protein